MSNGKDPTNISSLMVIGAKGLKADPELGAFVVVSIGKQLLFRTRTVSGCESVQWNESHPLTVSGPQSFSIAIHLDGPSGGTLHGEITNIICDSGNRELTFPVKPLTGDSPIIISIYIGTLEEMSIPGDKPYHERLIFLNNFIIKSISDIHLDLADSARLSVAIVVNGNCLYETTPVRKESSESNWCCNGNVILSRSIPCTVEVISENELRKRLGFIQLDYEILERLEEKQVIRTVVPNAHDAPPLEILFSANFLGQDTHSTGPQTEETFGCGTPGILNVKYSQNDAAHSGGNSATLPSSNEPSSSHSSPKLGEYNPDDTLTCHVIGTVSQEDTFKALQLKDLGEMLLNRFESEGDLRSLDDATSALRSARQRLPDGHKDHSICLWKLGLASLYLFQRLKKCLDIDDAIVYLEKGAPLFPDEDPNKSACLNKLGIAFRGRFASLGKISDLENAITVFEKAVALSTDSNPDKPGYLNNLGSSYQCHFEKSGEISALGKAISLLEHSVKLTPIGHPNKVIYLSHLGSLFQSRFETLGELSDLEKAIPVLADAVQLTTTSHPRKAMYLSDLGITYKWRFQRLGKISDLEMAISVLENAVNLTPTGDPYRARYLNNLGSLFQMKFERHGEISDLDKAISLKEDAVQLIPTGHSDKPMHLSNLGNSFESRFERLGNPSDLNKAISFLEEAVKLTTEGYSDSDKATYLSNLGIKVQTRFQRLGEISDLERAISLQEIALRLTPDGHPEKATFLSNLGSSLQYRFRRLGEISDLEKAICLMNNAVDLTPTDHPNKAGYLNNLGNSFQYYFDRLGEPTDLAKAITAKESAVELTPDDHPNKVIYLNNLGISLQKHFDTVGDISYLEKAISVKQTAVGLIPTGHPSKARQLSNLGISFQCCFGILGKISDLKEAISVKELAIELTPNNHPSKAMYLSNLGISFQKCFERLGKISDLEKAISLLENAVDLTPTNHPSKAAYLNNLGNSFQCSFERLGEITDLEKAISAKESAIELTPSGHPDKPMYLSNLGNTFGSCFDRLGKIPDLEKAISLLEMAVELTNADHPSKAMFLSNLGILFHSRFKRLGEISDLQRAISAKDNAAKLTPAGHPQKPMYLSNLGATLHASFDRLGEVSDLEKAISVEESAVEFTPAGHPAKAMYLNNLGISLQCHFFTLDEISSLDRSISVLKSAVEHDHPNKAGHLNNLGNSYQCRFEMLGTISDLDMAILVKENAIELTPTDHPKRATFLTNLGYTYQSRLERLGETSDLDKVLSCFSQAAQFSSSPPAVQFKAATLWARCAESSGHSSIQAYHHALNLLPHVAWIGLTMVDRYSHLSEISNVVHDAATAAITAGQYEMAIEWLEQGRSIVWNQILHLRTPVDDLLEKEPALATQLLAVSQALDMASARELNLENNLSPEQIAQKHHQLALEWDRLVEKVQKVPGFERFLQPKKVSQLIPAAKLGPVIVISIDKTGCHALILKSTSDRVLPNSLTTFAEENYLPQQTGDQSPLLNSNVVYIPLPNFSLGKVQDIQLALRRLCKSRFVREVVFENDTETPHTTFEEILADLWTLVVLPILNGLKFSTSTNNDLPHIWWCPTGPLAFLPIHAAGLYNTEERGHKLSNFAISSYIPTITALLNAQDNPLPATTCKIFAIAQASGKLPLPNTAIELEHLKKRAGDLHIESLEGTQATVDRVVQGMAESTWVHLACHGNQSHSNPTKSAFVLADGNLELSRIIKMTLPQAEFAFLSACQTAAGEVTLQEEAVHLAAGMLLAGYRSVIATMWSIRDRDGPLVADDVYAELLRNGQPDHTQAAHALHHAVQNLRSRGAPFLSWAPFIHLGR